MITKLKLPKADANMIEGTIGKWLVSEGDTVMKNQPVVEIVTDKTVFELESPKAGIIRKISAPRNSVVPPNFVIALIGKKDDTLPEIDSYNQRLLQRHSTRIVSKKEKSHTLREPPAEYSTTKRFRATPSAKRLARTNNINIEDIAKLHGDIVINEKMVRQFIEQRQGGQ
ncbi:MAG: hypothetical protein JW808_05490 [Victivallales bacterium]|nr:hypothetical protein [Victivallales bacterium]